MTDASNYPGRNDMAANVHPTSGELGIAARDPERAAAILDHIHNCVACRVRLARISRDLGFEPPDNDSLQRVLAASSPLPDGLGELIRAERDGDPQPGEVWRVGRDEALLVWTRRVFDDGIADVVPLVLDIELADDESVLVGADATPLATKLAAMVALRTHIDLGAFINRIGDLDLHKEVNEVMTAVREGRRPSGVPVGPPIEDDSDRRIEYRQALRDFLSELTPDAWAEITSAEVQLAGERQFAEKSPSRLDGATELLIERVDGVQCRTVDEYSSALNDGASARAVLKVSCLDTAVLIVMIEGGPYETSEIVEACKKMIQHENDVEAVAVTIPGMNWLTSLFTSSSLRQAIGLPHGADIGPQAVFEGHHLVDTLAKHFDGATTVWDLTEQLVDRKDGWDLRRVVSAHAEAAIEAVREQGRRAHQAAKKAAWQAVPAGLAEQVARFVDAVVNNHPADEALDELGLEEDLR
ncbi:hypothetical protein [Amycolatopsis sp. H20-H5]|uniref:hypothetical protein n=1 Tax=Amycolatopsis sp. H20-H5 TaxID=3046309 RepID=UPI002DBBB936|nr:hypothetical protein [Amycolatopsis sp. H20-H5]MEC3978722.1 hypothetical protein [Amycolatopsis sp. H20-H5]